MRVGAPPAPNGCREDAAHYASTACGKQASRSACNRKPLSPFVLVDEATAGPPRPCDTPSPHAAKDCPGGFERISSQGRRSNHTDCLLGGSTRDLAWANAEASPLMTPASLKSYSHKDLAQMAKQGGRPRLAQHAERPTGQSPASRQAKARPLATGARTSPTVGQGEPTAA